jgi:hypothetical protein
VTFKHLLDGVPLVSRQQELRNLLEAPACRRPSEDPDKIEPIFIPFSGRRVVAQEQVLNRGYGLVMPRDEDHPVHSDNSSDKLLLFTLRKIEPKLLASNEFRQRLDSMLGA